MLLNKIDDIRYKKDIKICQSWVPIEKISIDLIHAFLIAEDSSFFEHVGFDLGLMLQAWDFYKKDKNNVRVFGGSTISQQTAKNVFLCSKRNVIRKIFELYFTLLLEGIWGKKRILEVYLNVIELGEGVYGVESACQKYYHKSCSNISSKQAALLAATTTNPKETCVLSPSSYLMKRAEIIRFHIRHSRALKQEIYFYISSNKNSRLHELT